MSKRDIDSSLSSYPFLSAATRELEENGITIDSLLKDDELCDAAINRIVSAVKFGKAMCEWEGIEGEDGELNDFDEKTALSHVELLSYPVARILVSILNEPEVTKSYIEGEVTTAFESLIEDLEDDSELGDEFDSFNLGTIELDDFSDEFDLELKEVRDKEVATNAAIADIWSEMDTDNREQFIETISGSSAISISVEDKPWSGIYRELNSNRSISFEDTELFSIPTHRYLSIVGSRDEWSLADEAVTDGRVILQKDDLLQIIKIKMKEAVSEGLPKEDIPNSICSQLNEEISILITRLGDTIDIIDLKRFPLLDTSGPYRPHTLTSKNTDEYQPVGTKDVDIPLSDIRQHYADNESVYKELGVINGYHTSWLGAEEHAGWYVNGTLEDESENPRAWNNNFPRWNRPSILPDDFDASHAGRSVYTTNTYAAREDFKTRYYRNEKGERIWMDEELDDEETQQLPDYDDLKAYSLIVDIDLEDEWKTRPLPEEHQEIVESRLEAWVDAFASFVGGNREDVFVVDSGGGAYVLTPPMATHKLTEEFDGEELHQINNAIQVRMRELTKILDDIITKLDDAPADLFSADAVQNKNRQWKTLLSLHASLDAVVHPIDPTEIDYDELQFEDVTEEHTKTALEWSKQFTSENHEKYTESIVNVLFGSSVFENSNRFKQFTGDNWVEILEKYINHKEEQAASNERVMEILESDTDISNVGVTTEKEKVDAAIAKIDLEEYLRSSHVQRWDTDNRSDGTVSFSPSTWRKPSPDANSCFFAPSGGKDGSPIFVDRKEGWTAGIVDLIAYQSEITNHPSETPTGTEWWEAVDVLRSLGEDIPVYLPDITDDDYDYDSLGNHHIARAAVALDIADEENIVEKTGSYGTYETLDNDELYNKTLEELEERDIKHGKEKR